MTTILLNTQEVLSAPGNGTAVTVEDFENWTLAYTVATINTNVIVKPQGSLDGTNFFDLAASATQTANGTYAFTFTGQTPACKVARLNWVSEAGGTAATITTNFAGRR